MYISQSRVIVFAVVSVTFFSLASSLAGQATPIPIEKKQELVKVPSILEPEALKAVEPCEDFYQFACGGYIDQMQIPNDKTSINRQITPLIDAVDVTLNKVLQTYADGDFTIQTSSAKKLGDVYRACIDMDKEKKSALKLMRKNLNRITTVKTVNAKKPSASFAKLIAELQLQGAGELFVFSSYSDPRNSDRMIGEAGQGGIAFGERDYYLKQDAKSVEIRRKYLEFVTRAFKLIGANSIEAKKSANAVMTIETQLAKASYSLDDLYDPIKTTHLINREGLVKLAPDFDWVTYFKAIDVKDPELNVDEPEFFIALDQVLKTTAQVDMIRYLKWQWINRSLPAMGGEYTQAAFDFWDAYLHGTKEQKAQWKKCTNLVEASALNYGLAEAYVTLFDGKTIKAYTESMIAQIKEAFVADLDVLTHGTGAWMDQSTLGSALEKVKIMSQKVGAPEKFRDYSKLQVSRDGFLHDAYALSEFNAHRVLGKIGKPTDKTEWDMMPWEVNAYYDSSINGFVFPFGTLQPPVIDVQASDGSNYGSFGGGTIGHELSHGFDSSGRKYDAKGNLKDWWTVKTAEQFTARSQCYIAQASKYLISSVGLNVAGERVLTENLADQGGVKIGYIALNKILTTRKEAPLWLGKYTERQQYWIAYAQSWCSKATPEALRAQMTVDPHPPAEFRVNGVLMNRPEFAKDFRCKVGARMAPEKRCELW